MGVQFLDHLGHEEVILQSDAEPAVLNVERPLISVGKLAKDGCEINFDGTGGFIHHKGEKSAF